MLLNDGAIALKKIPTATLVAELRCSVATANAWKAGRRKPNDKARQRIWELWQIAPGAFDRDQEPVKVTPGALAVVPGSATPEAVISEADLMLAELRQLQRALAAGEGGETAQARLDCLAQAARILTTLGKLTGVGLTVTTRQILSSPNWRLIEDTLTDALHDHPEALLALADALEGLRNE